MNGPQTQTPFLDGLVTATDHRQGPFSAVNGGPMGVQPMGGLVIWLKICYFGCLGGPGWL